MNIADYKETVEDAIRFINDGGSAVYVFGLWNDGGTPKSREWALEKLNTGSWSFGMGFYNLNYIMMNGHWVLQFKELHENDMF